jgi:hypothetical protein
MVVSSFRAGTHCTFPHCHAVKVRSACGKPDQESKAWIAADEIDAIALSYRVYQSAAGRLFLVNRAGWAARDLATAAAQATSARLPQTPTWRAISRKCDGVPR